MSFDFGPVYARYPLDGTIGNPTNGRAAIGLTRLWNAVARLAGRLEALVSTVGAIDGELRHQGYGPSPPPAGTDADALGGLSAAPVPG
jgi:hypothetical protein